jgi:hypothetical protein
MNEELLPILSQVDDELITRFKDVVNDNSMNVAKGNMFLQLVIDKNELY